MASIINQSFAKQLSARFLRVLDKCVLAGRNANLPFSSKKPQLIHKPGSNFARFVLEKCPLVTESYHPTIWCFGGGAQTFAGRYLRENEPVEYRRELVQLQDGGEIALDWLDGASEKSANPATHPTVLISTGLAGSSRQTAVLQLVKQLAQNGYRVAVFNNPGSAGVPLKTPKMFSVANTEDVDSVISHIHNNYPGIPLLAVGFCVGGMALTRYLIDAGSQKKDSGLVAALTISMPWHGGMSMRSLEEPLNYFLLSRFLTKYMQKMIWRNRAQWRKDEDQTYADSEDMIKRALQCKSLHELDDVLIAPMYGFENADAYHDAVSLDSRLGVINVPLLCLNAADDPLVPGNSIPCEVIRKSPIVLALTSRGGHIGFTEGLFPAGPSFADKLACQYVKAIFNRELPTSVADSSQV